MKAVTALNISGLEVHPLIEGGKGVSVSNGFTSGAFAAAGGVGTFSCVNPDSYDEQGVAIPQIYHGKTRRERFGELIKYAIDGGITQAKIAHETASGQGRIHMNVLWEAGGTEAILHGVLEQTKGMVHAITCGAGMPYKVAEIAASYNVYYYPIISSARAFRALWKRSYHKNPEWLGGVVYEDPWLAGGHNGLSNSENAFEPETPYDRVKALRDVMRDAGQGDTLIVMAGGVWYLRDWEDWLDNPELGPIAFQYGTRPILTQESPVSKQWIAKYQSLKEGDIYLNKFSPTGFYSSAVRNEFLNELDERTARQVDYATEATEELPAALPIGARGRPVYMTAEDKEKSEAWIAQGFTEGLKSPDSTLIFVTPEKGTQILTDQQECMGCLSACRFSNWADNEEYQTGRRADPRSFCIQKTLQSIAHDGSVENNLMFAGHNAYMFAQDPFYKDGFIPTVKQLVDRMLTGD